ncbi:hypothetical protein [Kineococcus arenarius]|uniref:hypothetical protein n=1 Tax=Kineococcus sp. SYSU DK007 TaxID=3383128 RepID=UPI003D7C6006
MPRTPPTAPSRERAVPHRRVPVAALVLGAVLGAAATAGLCELGVLPLGTPTAQEPGAVRDAAPPTGALEVPEACWELAGVSVEAVDLARRTAESIAQARARDLVPVLERLEELDPRVRELAASCDPPRAVRP